MAKKIVQTKPPSLKRIIAQINKKSKGTVIGTLETMTEMDIFRIPTGIKGLDEAMGGGFPGKRIVELYGLPSGGKSLISLLAIKSVQERGGSAVLIDVEKSFDASWAGMIGVDIKDLYVSQLQEGEDIFNMVCSILSSRPEIIVIDSVAALVTNPEMEDPMEKAHMALKARLMGKGVPKVNALNKNTCIMFINQLRSTLTMYGAPTTTPGGRTLTHFASLRLEVKKGELLRVDGKKTTEVIGQVVNYNVTKNKTAQPYKKGRFKLFHTGARVEE